MRTWAARLAGLGLLLAVGGALAAAVSALGVRQGSWAYPAGFVGLRWSVYAVLGGLGLSLLGALGGALARAPRALAMGALGILVGGVAFAVPWGHLRVARSVPPIHDITTDTESPPAFVDVLPLRADASNPAEYGGPDVAAQQRRAYPDLGPAVFELPRERVFEAARSVVAALGWELVDEDAAAGRIEATDTTFWFGFKDDVVIRVADSAEGTRVDVRSLSRVGGSDIGANAARIRAYLERLSAELEG